MRRPHGVGLSAIQSGSRIVLATCQNSGLGLPAPWTEEQISVHCDSSCGASVKTWATSLPPALPALTGAVENKHRERFSATPALLSLVA
jgi:hypothetical protein